jgi:1,4-alpha-glucan branching enzyme
MYMDGANKQFGAWRLNDAAMSSAVKFSIFFPDRAKDPGQYASKPQDKNGNVLQIANYGNPQIKSIHVAGSFQSSLGQVDWTVDPANAMTQTAHPQGSIWSYTTALLPQGFYEYKYVVTFQSAQQRWVSDPCSRYGGSAEFHNSGFVVGPSPIPTTNPLPTPRKHLRDLVVYEINLDDWTVEFRDGRAPFDAACDKLDYLAGLGVNAVLCMPWTAWFNDNYSWGYTPYQYFSVEHRYTQDLTDCTVEREIKQLSRLRNFINECHKRNIHVIMDGVFNHVGPDVDPNYSGFAYRWLYQDPDASPYSGIFGGTFGDLKDLDYHNGCTQQFIADVCKYWIDEFKIDGIRFDNTTNFYIDGDSRGLPTLISDIKSHVPDPNFSLTLEHLDLSAARVTNQTGATSYWNNALYQRCFGYLWDGKIDSNLMGDMDTHAWLDPGKVATIYPSNHDHSHVTWQCGARDNSGSMSWYRTQPYAILLLTCPGSPLIHSGIEFGEEQRIMEDDHGSSRRVATRATRWEFLGDSIGVKLSGVYKTLLSIHNDNAGLRSDNFYPAGWQSWQTQFNPLGFGVDVNRQVMIYHRWGTGDNGKLQRFIVVVNFSDQDQVVNVPFPANDDWQDLLNGNAVSKVNDFWIRNWRVNSNWGNIFYEEG